MVQKNKEKFDKEVFLKYLKSTGRGKAEGVLQRWLDNPGTEHELYKESLKFWDRISPEQKTKGYNGDYLLDRIHHHIKIEEGIFLNKSKPKVSIISHLSRIAAVLFIPLFVASLLLLFQNKSFRNEISWAEIHAPYGTRTDFHLPDGSTGHLNGGSTIKFPAQFTGKVRNIRLTGEAYFNVISNLKKPFVISTEKIDVKATGTSFNVMAYPEEKITEVTLLNGKVEVFKKGDNVVKSLGVLKPDESLIYHSGSDSGKIQSGNSADKLSWIDGKLTFKYEPFDEVIRKLNRWYNVNIVIKDTLLESYVYYGAFRNETLDEVLKLLQYTAPIRYKNVERQRKQDGTFEKRKVEIYSKN